MASRCCSKGCQDAYAPEAGAGVGVAHLWHWELCGAAEIGCKLFSATCPSKLLLAGKSGQYPLAFGGAGIIGDAAIDIAGEFRAQAVQEMHFMVAGMLGLD